MLRLLKFLYGLAAICFLIAPLIVILPLAFTPSSFLNYPMHGFSLRWFKQLFSADIWQTAILNSLLIGAAVAVLSTVLGTLAALGLRNMTNFFYRFCHVMFLMPMVAPVVVLGVGMQILFSRLGLTNSYGGVIIAHSVIAVPFVLVNVSASLSSIDRAVEHAAMSLGASPAKVFRRITLPLIMPGVQSGALFAFATSLDEVVLTLFVGGLGQRTIAREMFSQLRDNFTPVIAAVAFLFIIGTLCLTVALIAVRERRQTRLLRG